MMFRWGEYERDENGIPNYSWKTYSKKHYSGVLGTDGIFFLLLFFSLNAGLLATGQYSVGPATGHPNTGFSWFPCA